MEYTVYIGAAAAVVCILLLWSNRTLRIRKDEQEKELLLAQQRLRQLEDQQNSADQEKREYIMQVEQLRQLLGSRDQRIAQLESEEKQRQRDVEQQVQELDSARKLLEQERERVLVSERERQQQEAENRDRQWALHEQETVKLIRELAGRGDLYFPCYDNTSLPEGFDQSLKPDVLIRFLDQYVIFDAKLSKSQNLQAYLLQQAKTTAKKLSASAERELVFQTVFFVVPSMDIGSLKTLSCYEDGYRFFFIPPESAEPILSLFKRLETYEFAEAWNPQEREQIVQVLASLEHHIRHQNAVHVLSVLKGIQALEAKDVLDEQMHRDIMEKRKSIRIENFTPSSLRRLIQDDKALRDEVLRIMSPKPPAVDSDDLAGIE